MAMMIHNPPINGNIFTINGYSDQWAAVVDLSRIPQNDGEANWPVIGAEVGRIGDETAIYVYSAWYRLEPEK